MKLAAPARLASVVVALSLTACGSSGEWDDADESAPVDTPLESTASSALTGSPAAGARVVTTTRLNMRTGPSTSSSIIRVLPEGAALSLTAPGAENGFYRVRDESGRDGYCHGAYLRAVTGDESTSPPPPPPVTSGAFPTSGTFESRGTGYYPDASPLEGGFVDRKGAKLRTLQQYLAGSAEYVSVAMDVNAFAYGQKLRIKELEQKYGRTIEFRVVDTGGAFKGRGRTRIDVCTANEKASLDPTINSDLTIAAVD